MLSKNIVSVVLATAVVIGAVRLPAAPCILSNAPTEKACMSGCCKNKSCCETSHQRTGLPVQPLSKAGSNQQNIAILPATVPVAVFNYAAEQSFVFSGTESAAHSPPPLALLCIRLI